MAVIGDGALPSGIVFEALNNAGGICGRELLVILNDNQMSICPRTGGTGHLPRSVPADELLPGFEEDGFEHPRAHPAHRRAWRNGASNRLRDGLKAILTGGMLFEELGFRYFGPVDGHDLPTLRQMAQST